MCWLPYEFQAKILALIEIATSSVGFAFVTVGTFVLGFSPELREEILKDEPNSFLSVVLQFSLPEKVTSVAVPIIYFICEFILAVFLYRSVALRIYSHIRIWFIVTITLCMTALYFFLPGVFFTDDSAYFLVIFIGSYAFTAYSVWVVHKLMREMKSEGLHAPIATYDAYMEKLQTV